MESFQTVHSHEQFVYVINSKAIHQLEYYSLLPASNKSDLKETIRFISEALVWSEQNNCSFFE